jgi:hypothetical protein
VKIDLATSIDFDDYNLLVDRWRGLDMLEKRIQEKDLYPKNPLHSPTLLHHQISGRPEYDRGERETSKASSTLV